MKNLRLTIAVFGIMVMVSCSKSNDDTNPTVNTLPKTYTEDVRSASLNSVTTYNLTYDGNHRIISMVSTPEPAVLKFVYQYPSSILVTMDMYNNGSLGIHEDLMLNGSGLLDSTFQYNDTNDSSTEKYLYTNGFLTKMNSYDYSKSGSTLTKTTTYTYDAIGNISKQVDDPGATLTYTYYNKQYDFFIGNSFVPQPLNYIRSITSTGGGPNVTAMHYYGFDGNDRLIADTIKTTGGPEDVVVIKSYTY